LCELRSGCRQKVTCQIVSFVEQTTKISKVWYRCDLHGARVQGLAGYYVCKLKDVESF